MTVVMQQQQTKPKQHFPKKIALPAKQGSLESPKLQDSLRVQGDDDVGAELFSLSSR